MRKLIMLFAMGLCSAVFAAEMSTWPEGLQSWEAVSEATVDVVELQIQAGSAEKAPTSKPAVRITVPDGTWRPAARSTKATGSIRTSTTLEIDLLVPPDAMPTGTGAFAGLDITIRGQSPKGEAKPFRIAKRLKLDTTSKDWREYHFTWRYVDEEAFSKAAASAQLIINTQSSGSAPWTVYVTSIRLGK